MPRSARRFNRFLMTDQLGVIASHPDAGGGGAPPATPPATPPVTPAPLADPSDPGFPANTPIAEMNPAEQVAYWKHQSRKHEARANERGDYDALKEKAAAFDKVQQASESEHEKALRETRETAMAEGRKAAMAESSTATVRALLEGALKMRGQSAEEIAQSTKHVDLASFVTNGDVDHDAITGLVTRLAGPIGPDTTRLPDFGQGNRGNNQPAKGVTAGAEMFAAARKAT